MKVFLYILSIILLIEIFLFFIFKFLQSKIPWIISNKDEYPFFDKIKVNNFLKKTYDPLLGWNWKPNTKHKEKINFKTNNIYFGKLGERKSLKLKNKRYKFASFGDSFVFCRYVKNNQTWQNYLIDSLTYNGLNFGVGNFGLDQIYLKYSKTSIPKNIKTIFIGFVPETLSRCLCTWKHYHEFNNIYGFKPKFVLNKKKLLLIKNPIRSQKSFSNIDKIIDSIKYKEFFYKEKFLKYKLNFPYFFSFLKNSGYYFKLIAFSFLKIFDMEKNKIYDLIINQNCKKNDFYYSKKENKDLIYKILKKFSVQSKKKKHKIIFLVFPQKYDLLIPQKKYQNFFLKMNKKFNVIDFTEIFQKEDIDKLYLPGRYGGHLTSYGNKIVAKTLIHKRLIL
jgi:hypothetical protein